MDSISPVVISPRPAQDHLNMIKGQHADILTGIQNQAMKIAQFNANKVTADKEKASLDAQANKDNALNMQKQQELELKRMALSQ